MNAECAGKLDYISIFSSSSGNLSQVDWDEGRIKESGKVSLPLP